MITVDTSDAEQFLDGLYREQIPFAASLALNRTAKDVQEAERGELLANFTVRQARFILDSVRIPAF